MQIFLNTVGENSPSTAAQYNNIGNILLNPFLLNEFYNNESLIKLLYPEWFN